MASSAEIMALALSLEPETRAALAFSLLESVDDTDDDVAEAWSTEIGKRVEDVRQGSVKTVPWSDVEAKAEALIRRHE
ncbi:MAG: addiction module protein [Myxococcales bacterium FL481]|nr:MAG: addiction module protein [Myxococcales bacterium FL481]